VALYHSGAFVYMSAKDPLCGMLLDASKTQFTANFLSRQYYFGSEYCISSFIEDAKIAYFSMEIGINTGMPEPKSGFSNLV
jgi:starch phosphorylase